VLPGADRTGASENGSSQWLTGRGGWHRLRREDIGQDLIEYAMLVAPIGFMAPVSLSPVAQVLSNGGDKTHKKFKDHVDHGLHKGWYKLFIRHSPAWFVESPAQNSLWSRPGPVDLPAPRFHPFSGATRP
jgi:hypothetical protein